MRSSYDGVSAFTSATNISQFTAANVYVKMSTERKLLGLPERYLRAPTDAMQIKRKK